MTAVNAHSTQSLISNLETAEQEKDGEFEKNFQLEELFFKGQELFVYINTAYYFQMIFHFTDLIQPNHYSCPPTKPPILSV